MTTREVASVRHRETGGPTLGRALRPAAKVLPEHARSHNRSLVLQTLYRAEGLSRADIARAIGLTRVTISDLVAELIAEGLVLEQGHREDARPGKPATMLDINRTGFQIIGLDLSEQSVFRGAVLDLDGKVLVRADIDRGDATGETAVDKAISLAKTLIAQTTAPVLGVGVGSPGIVNDQGVVLAAPNLGWHLEALQATLNRALDLPVLVANDANVAVLAEHSFGEAASDVILIKVGHGVGAALLVGGSPVLGRNFAAGEIGHVVVGTDRHMPCVCGKSGCLETWLSAPRLNEALSRVDPDDAGAQAQVLREAGERLGIAVAPIVAALNPAEIVLSGPPELLDGTLAQAALDTIRSRTMTELHPDLTVRMTSQAQDIILRGAAVMVLSHTLGVS